MEEDEVLNQETENQTQEQLQDDPIEEDSLAITIGEPEEKEDDQENQPAPAWVKDLRKSQRELQRENRELREKLKVSTPEPVLKLEERPTLEDCDYDTEVFAEKLLAWNEKKREIDSKQAQQRKAMEDAEKEWQDKLHGYQAAKQKLKLTDYEDAEMAVQEVMNVTQQGIILQGSDNPAVLVYALGKNPSKAKELAAITDPVKFSFAVSKLEAQLKVTNKKSVPAPEKVISSSGGARGGISSSDRTLERLREEAQKTGDMTKVMQYKRQLANKK